MAKFQSNVSVKRGMNVFQAKTDLQTAHVDAFIQLLNLMIINGNPEWREWSIGARDHLRDHLTNVAQSI